MGGEDLVKSLMALPGPSDQSPESVSARQRLDCELLIRHHRIENAEVILLQDGDEPGVSARWMVLRRLDSGPSLTHEAPPYTGSLYWAEQFAASIAPSSPELCGWALRFGYGRSTASVGGSEVFEHPSTAVALLAAACHVQNRIRGDGQ